LFEDVDYKKPPLSRAYSQPSFQVIEEPGELSSSGSSLDSLNSGDISTHRDLYERHTRSMYVEGNPTKTKDPFMQRQEEIETLMKSLKSELKEFKSSLQNTEELVTDVQLDMDDFRNRMETYIKDIPESHYSAVRHTYS
jgi:peptidoglycan hydrolase CwlO-like protein